MRIWISIGVCIAMACDGGTTGDGSGGSTSTTPTTSSTTAGTGNSGSGSGVMEGTADGSDSTGGGPPPACIEDSECGLIDDCNLCRGVYVGGGGAPGDGGGGSAVGPGDDPGLLGDPPSALDIPPPTCEMTQCELWGSPVPECRFGHCVISKLHCGLPACDALPPECDPPFVPLIDAGGGCWTGSCGPAYLCDEVSSCLDCVADTVCVTFEGATAPTCEQPPAECDGTAECECAGAAICGDAPCSVVDGGIVCG